MAEFKYCYSKKTRCKNGRIFKFKRCDICGGLTKTNYGYEINFQTQETYWVDMAGLCRRCAKNMDKILEKASQEVIEEKEKLKKQYQNIRG